MKACLRCGAEARTNECYGVEGDFSSCMFCGLIWCNNSEINTGYWMKQSHLKRRYFPEGVLLVIRSERCK